MSAKKQDLSPREAIGKLAGRAGVEPAVAEDAYDKLKAEFGECVAADPDVLAETVALLKTARIGGEAQLRQHGVTEARADLTVLSYLTNNLGSVTLNGDDLDKSLSRVTGRALELIAQALEVLAGGGDVEQTDSGSPGSN